MKIQVKNVFRHAGSALVIAALSVLSFTEVAAQTQRSASIEKITQPTPSSLAATVYQLDNSLKFKLHFENSSDNDVNIKIRNSANQLVYTETVKGRNAKKYVRKFDLSTLPDGEYTFEVSNRTESFTKDIQLQTMSARSLAIE
jgi:flagellar hook assembly protein FlgD